MGVSVVDQFDVKSDGDALPFDGDPFAGEFVEFFPADFFCAEHGRCLKDCALEFEQGIFDVGEGRDKGIFREDFAIDVIGVGDDPETDGSEVFFILIEEAIAHFGERLADEQDHHTICERVEGACMADFSDLREFTHLTDQTERGSAFGFGYRKNPFIQKKGFLSSVHL